jgi:hypothetical protein
MKTTLADTWFSRYIRLRAADVNGIGSCVTCGRVGHVKHMDCGHYIKRQHAASRFSEINCQLQCKRCNSFEQGADVKFRLYLVDKYGKDKVQLLESGRRLTVKRGKFEIAHIAETYRELTNKLIKEKGIDRWW